MKSVAIITGANRGIGKGIAQRFFNADIPLILTSRLLEEAETTVQEFLESKKQQSSSSSSSSVIKALEIDVSQPESISKLTSFVSREFIGCAPFLIANAAVSFEGWDSNTFEKTLNINCWGAIRSSEAILPILYRVKLGRIILISSGFGQLNQLSEKYQSLIKEKTSIGLKSIKESKAKTAFQCWTELTSAIPFDQTDEFMSKISVPCYKLSKALLNCYGRLLALQLSRDIPGANIRVCIVDPGWVKTRMGGKGAHREIDQGSFMAFKLANLEIIASNEGECCYLNDNETLSW